MDSDSHQSQPTRALSLLSAIIMGNATIEDLAMELRKHGLDLSSLKLWKKTVQDSSIVQRVPKIPFILNGIMYDPKDITRFNGHELHFVPALAGDHLLVVDNRALIKSWLRLAYHEQNEYRSYQRFGPGGPTPMPNPYDPFNPNKPPTGYGWYYPHGGGTGTSPAGAMCWEDINAKGSSLHVRPNRGYKNLTKKSMGIFGNWNDEISSVTMNQISQVTLYEHINWQGQTLNLFRDDPDLRKYGWNDRASGVAAYS